MEHKVATTTEGQPIRCKAVCRKAGEPLSIEEIIVAPPMPGEARIRITCSTLCQTDISFWNMQVILEMTDGGADYCFECVGMASLMQEAYVSCRKGWGKTIVLGVDKPGSKLNLSCSEVHVCGKSLRGCLFGGLKPKSHVPILLKRYMDKQLNLDEFVTHEMEFKDINKTFDVLIDGVCLRCGPPVIFPTILGHEAIG
ncbi:Alcohol dehydrogenase-like 7 [Glycine max]|nr:Alcohol dehydrogenase-like 7 [Glycine max]